MTQGIDPPTLCVRGPERAARGRRAAHLVARALGLALALPVSCASPEAPPDTGTPSVDSLVALAADPSFEGTWWRLATLAGDAPAEGVGPVLVFTETPALRDTYDRPYPDSLAGWRIVTGDLGVGHLHAPYRLERAGRAGGRALRFLDPYDYTRLSTAAEQVQARRLADALVATRTAVQDGPRLALLGADGDTLATFTADPPRPPGPLDDAEWVLAALAGRPVPAGTRADLTFSSRRLGPGDGDGFDGYGGYSGCNWYSGGYRLTAIDGPGRYRLETNGPPMATERGCAEPAGPVEDAVLGAMARAALVEVARDGEPTDDGRSANALALRDSAGTLLLAFRRHEPYPVDLGALRSGRWRLAPTASPSGGRGAEVAFADSTFEGSNGCLRVRGTYRVEGDDLRVQAETADESACPPGGPHRSVPVGPGKLSVSGDRLVLYDENGAAITYTRPR